MFATCCQAGAIISNQGKAAQDAFSEFGLNFGIAFQIADDSRDIICKEKSLGKQPGRDMMMGEMTLPLMNLLETVGQVEKVELKNMLNSSVDTAGVEKIRQVFLSSNAAVKTEQTAIDYVGCAKQQLDFLDDSEYKVSLERLADYIIQKTF